MDGKKNKVLFSPPTHILKMKIIPVSHGNELGGFISCLYTVFP